MSDSVNFDAVKAYVAAVMGCDHIVCYEALRDMDEADRAVMLPIVKALFDADDGFDTERLDALWRDIAGAD